MRKRHASSPRARILTLATAGFAALFALQPPGASAVTIGGEIEVDAECVETCLTELGACLQDARQDFAQCSLEGNCLELAATMRLACKPDTTASVCLDARVDYRDCIAPCRAELRNDSKICRNEGLACLHDDCGLSDLPEQCGRVRVTTARD